jgi:hypothetical protein
VADDRWPVGKEELTQRWLRPQRALGSGMQEFVCCEIELEMVRILDVRSFAPPCRMRSG